ncbi:hypothetical protein FisN_11Hu348 [Fistulifera solaris]|jgi:hypothetical protein|uniref:Uncharacterized protein n=1 Tax=Fistulifera solaris TaxID=1519565 RepID=A0A1Z5K9G6_FISSO|nr:hypothetical protein FisN_11Hu348 [Fistulifera solaris]|eukprot:GAX22761.1 hypothetical protein FisN_11Hu348 [Fistulifera solaris]
MEREDPELEDRPYVPPPFYGIYDDDEPSEFTRDDLEVLYRASCAMEIAARQKMLAHFAPMEPKMMGIVTALKRFTGDPVMFEEALEKFSHVPSDLIEMEADNIVVETEDDFEDLLVVLWRIEEEREQLMLDYDNKVREIILDLTIVMTAHGWTHPDMARLFSQNLDNAE